MSCLSQFFVLTRRGNTIICKEFRGDLPITTTDSFYHNVRFFNGEQQNAPPIFYDDGITYFYVKNNGLYFVGTTKQCISPSFIMELLTKITKIFTDYIGILTEKTIKQNFILLYELLDEILDFGYAQSISTQILNQFILNKPLITSKKKNLTLLPQNNTTQKSNATQRPICYGGNNNKPSKNDTKNEIFVDISEKMSVTFNNKGNTIESSINGIIKMKSYLSNNPPLILALNNDLFVTDINFNEIVNLNKYKFDKILTFIPPNGEFNVLNYRITNKDFDPPFKIFPYFTMISPYKCELNLKIRNNIFKNKYGTNVCIEIPIFTDYQTVTTELENNINGQSVIFYEKDKKVIWKIQKFIGGNEIQMKIRITFKQRKSFGIKKQIGPVSMSFEIPMYNVSNVKVKYLHVSKPMVKYNIRKWVRYITQSESYICRL